MEGGRQMYCKDCADQAVKANVSAAKRIYNAENYDHLDAIARERKEGIKICQVCGKPVMEKSTSISYFHPTAIHVCFFAIQPLSDGIATTVSFLMRSGSLTMP